MTIADTSIMAFNKLDEEGKISEKRSQAFKALCKYIKSSENDRWPTKIELYEWAQANLDNSEFSFNVRGNFKPRITDLTPGYENTDYQLITYLDEKRYQDSDSTNQKAHPIKLMGFQSTLGGDSLPVKLKKEKLEKNDYGLTSPEEKEEEDGEDSDSEEVLYGESKDSDSSEPSTKIHYPTVEENGDTNVKKSSFKEAVLNTSQLGELRRKMKRMGKLQEYRKYVKIRRSDDEDSETKEESETGSSQHITETSGSEEESESSQVIVEEDSSTSTENNSEHDSTSDIVDDVEIEVDSSLIEKNGEKYIFDPGESGDNPTPSGKDTGENTSKESTGAETGEDTAESDSENNQSQLLLDQGELV